jgi:hypothetical protein
MNSGIAAPKAVVMLSEAQRSRNICGCLSLTLHSQRHLNEECLPAYRSAAIASRPLLQRLDLRLNLFERGLKRRTTRWVRGPLRKNVFPLQIQCLFLAFIAGTLLSGRPSSCFIHQALPLARRCTSFDLLFY